MNRDTQAEGRERLLEFARQHCLPTRAESLGRCLHATVLLARQSRALGVHDSSCFLRWTVKGDLDFLEHWALSWQPGYALDMAAAQIDGDATPLRTLESYPANYVHLRSYPVEPILSCLDASPRADGERYSARQLLALHWQLTKIDLRRSLNPPSPFAALDSMLRLCQAAFLLAASSALERALARLSRILLKSN